MLKGTPEDREVYITLANMNARLKRWPEAEDAANDAVQLSTKPEDKDYAQFLAGLHLRAREEVRPAEQLFKQLIATIPSNAAALNYLGYMLADRGLRLDEALGYIKQRRPARSAKWRVSRFTRMGLFQDGQLRHGRR